MGGMFSSLQCPAGECYKKIPGMALMVVRSDSLKATDLKELLKYKDGDNEVVITPRDVYNVLECLKIPIEDGVIKTMSEEHEHIFEKAMCCDMNYLEGTLASKIAESPDDMAMVKPVYDKDVIIGYKICDRTHLEEGCQLINATLMCQLGEGKTNPDGIIPIDKLVPLCKMGCDPNKSAILADQKLVEAKGENPIIAKSVTDLSTAPVTPPEPVVPPAPAPAPVVPPAPAPAPASELPIVKKDNELMEKIKEHKYVILLILVLLVAGVVGYYYYSKSSNLEAPQSSDQY